MKIKYKILCIDDNETWIDSAYESLKKIIEEEGFDFSRENLVWQSEDNIADINFNDYNMLLIDYDFGKTDSGKDKIKGNKIIKMVRDGGYLSQILFYSNCVGGVDELRASIAKDKIEGIYCSIREEGVFFDKFESLFKNAVKKIMDINYLRGAVISTSIDLESLMAEIIKKFFGMESHPREKMFSKKLLDSEVLTLGKKIFLIHSICKTLQEELKEKISKEDVDQKNKKLLETINKIYDKSKTLKEELLDVRNILSHVKPSEGNPNELKSLVKNMENIIINADWCRANRKNLNKHIENLIELKNRIF